MTDIEFGEPIRVDGVQPDWLRDEVGLFENRPGDWLGGVSDRLSGWAWSMEAHCPINIRLLADHPYYTVQNYNAENGTNFTYWPGGDSAPDDLSRCSMLFRNGRCHNHIKDTDYNWFHTGGNSDIIGYTKRNVPDIKLNYTYSPSDGVRLDSVTLYTEPQPDGFQHESPIRAFTDWKVQGLYAIGKGFRPSLAHLVVYLDAMESREGWQLVQILEAAERKPSFVFRRV